MLKSVMSNKLYIPVNKIDPVFYNEIVRNFTKTIELFLPPNACVGCYQETQANPPCDSGKNCPYKTKRLVMFDKIRTAKGNYIALWRGNIPLLKKILKFKVVDRRSHPLVKTKITFKGKLHKYQALAALNWIKTRHGGQIEAPARSGKTVIGCYLACSLQAKTLILTHQIDLLHQFYDTFKKFTDYNGNDSVVIAEKGNIVELVENGSDIILSTYQTFLSPKGKQRLKQLKNKFAFVIVDECHLVGADGFSKVVTSFNPYYILGLTATPDRKDGRDVLAKYAIGDVVSKVSPEQLKGKAIFTYTGTKIGSWVNWSTMLNRIAINARRNKLIVNYVIRDLKENHKIVLVTERRKQCDLLQELFKNKNIKAEILHGAIKKNLRQELIERIRKGEVDLTIATRKIVRFGLNIPPWSAYYCLSPINNKPNFYQEMSRIRTPYEHKKEPLVRLFVDNFSAAYSCAKTCEKVLLKEGFTIEKSKINTDVLKEINKRVKKITENAISRWNCDT